MKKVIILIDGANLFYSLKNLDLIEKEILWTDFFNHLLEKDDELIRTYWFRPQRIQSFQFTRNNLMNQIIYRDFNSSYNDFLIDKTRIPTQIINEINRKVDEAEKWIIECKKHFETIERHYDEISLEFSDVEIVKTGIVKINPYKKIHLGEKGVDIALAVKMISLSVGNRCEKIILVSGDYDYAEAINFVKDNMTKVHIVKFHKGIPPKNKSMSKDLSILADKVINIYESELKNIFRKPIAT